MHLTLQARIDPIYNDLLQQEAERYAYYMSDMFRLLASGKDNWPEMKSNFHYRHGLPHRLVSSLHTDLQGKLDSIRELNKDRLEILKEKSKSLNASLKTKKVKIDKVKAGQLKFDEKITYAKLCLSHWHSQHKLDRVTSGIRELEQQEQKNVPSICFGSKELFKKQWFLEENKLTNEEWYQHWWAARNHQLFYLGSKDETSGCQNCQAHLQADGKLSLKVRRYREDSEYLTVNDIEINQHKELIEKIIKKEIKQAISYRFHRDEKGWRVFLQIDIPAAEIATLNKQYGVLGVDFNGNHLAVTETDLHGNMTNFKRFDILVEGTTGQRRASLELALQKTIALALLLKKPVVIEKLDFKKKKKELYKATPRQARALSSLLYGKFTSLMESKTHRLGVELIKVKPAYTSVIGRVKYARARGISVHMAAAGVIARRGQLSYNKERKESYPRTAACVQQCAGLTIHLPLPVRKDGKSLSQTQRWKMASRAQETILRPLWSAWAEFNDSAQGQSSVKSFAISEPFQTCKRKLTNHAATLFSCQQHDQICLA